MKNLCCTSIKILSDDLLKRLSPDRIFKLYKRTRDRERLADKWGDYISPEQYRFIRILSKIRKRLKANVIKQP